MAKYEILGIGGAFVDVVSKISDSFLDELKLKKGNRVVMSNSEEKFYLKNLVFSATRSGGSAANTIMTLSYLGVSSGFIGCVGGDNFGRFFTKNLEDNKVANFCDVQADQHTSWCVSLVSPDGERTMSAHIGASNYIQGKKLTSDLIDNIDMLYTEIYQLGCDNSRVVLEKSIDLAAKAGKTIALGLSDVNYITLHHDYIKESLFSHVHIFFGNEFEWFTYYKTDNLDTLVEIVKQAVANHPQEKCTMVITMGEKGAIIVDKQAGLVQIDAVKVKVIDLTGAGDSFAAGFLNAYLKNKSLLECGKFGSEIASLVIQKHGGCLSSNNQNTNQMEDN